MFTVDNNIFTVAFNLLRGVITLMVCNEYHAECTVGTK